MGASNWMARLVEEGSCFYVPLSTLVHSQVVVVLRLILMEKKSSDAITALHIAPSKVL